MRAPFLIIWAELLFLRAILQLGIAWKIDYARALVRRHNTVVKIVGILEVIFIYKNLMDLLHDTAIITIIFLTLGGF